MDQEVAGPRKRLYELLEEYAAAEARGSPPNLVKVTAVQDYQTPKFGMLSLKAGDVISVLEPFDEKWSFGVVKRTVGMFPVAVVRFVDGQNPQNNNTNTNNTNNTNNINNNNERGSVQGLGSEIQKMALSPEETLIRQEKAKNEKEVRKNEVDLCGEEFVMNASCLLDSGALELLVINDNLWVTLSNGQGLVLSTHNLKAIAALEGLGSKRSYVLLDAHPAANSILIMNEGGILLRYDRDSFAFQGKAQSQHQGMVKCGVVANTLLWTGDVMGCVCVWDVKQDCSPVKRFRIGEQGFSHGSTTSLSSPLGDPRFAALSMCFVPASRSKLPIDEVWVGSSGRIHRYDASSFAKLGEVGDYPRAVDVTRLCVSGMNVYSSGNDNLVRVWDPLNPKQCLNSLEAHTGLLFFLSFFIPTSSNPPPQGEPSVLRQLKGTCLWLLLQDLTPRSTFGE